MLAALFNQFLGVAHFRNSKACTCAVSRFADIAFANDMRFPTLAAKHGKATVWYCWAMPWALEYDEVTSYIVPASFGHAKPGGHQYTGTLQRICIGAASVSWNPKHARLMAKPVSKSSAKPKTASNRFGYVVLNKTCLRASLRCGSA